MKGGNQVELEKIQDNLKVIQQQLDDAMQTIKTSNLSTNSDNDFYGLESSMPKSEEMTLPVDNSPASSDLMKDYGSVEPVESKPWQDDKTTKFYDGNNGRVSLSFPRIMMLIDGNISKGNVKKNWTSIKEQLLNATSVDQVKSVIQSNTLNFSSNSVSGGTRKKRKGGRRKKTSKRR